MKKILSMMVVLALLVSTAALGATTEKAVVTGRTEQARETGVIIPAPLPTEVLHNVTKELVLSGKVIIDGPQLVFTAKVNGESNGGVSVVKVADRTWTYCVTVDPSSWKGPVTLSYSAKTIYINGATAGQTHTSAQDQTRTLRVAYVADFTYTDFAWGDYDREHNLYPYSYTLVKIWDNGQMASEPVTGTVAGTGVVQITGNDATFDGGPKTLAAMVPPLNVRSFAVNNEKWTYNEGSYDLDFTLTVILSNGVVETQAVTIKGIVPSTAYNYTALDQRSPGYSEVFSFTAPADPAPEKPAVTDVKVTNPDYVYTGNAGSQQRNVKVTYTLNYRINGQASAEPSSFTFNSSTGYCDQNMTYPASFNGGTVTIQYTLRYVQPDSADDNTTK